MILPLEIFAKIVDYCDIDTIIHLDIHFSFKKPHIIPKIIDTIKQKVKKKIILIYGSKDLSLGLICPYCNYACICENGNHLQFDDYVDLPMLWCDSCGARCVLDITINDIHQMLMCENPIVPKSIVHKQAYIKYVTATLMNDHQCCDNINNNRTEVCYYFVDLLHIKKVVNFDLDRFKPKESHTPSQDDLFKLIESNYDSLIADKLGLEYVDENYIYDFIMDDEKPLKYIQKMGIICNSYNSQRPSVKYPSNFELSHDGVYVYMECIKHNGDAIVVKYWGD